MNQISKAAQPDLRTTETVWNAPASPSVEYDKDGNPATVVVEFLSGFRSAQVAPRAQAPAMHIRRSSFADYDDGNPGTVLA